MISRLKDFEIWSFYCFPFKLYRSTFMVLSPLKYTYRKCYVTEPTVLCCLSNNLQPKEKGACKG